MNEPVSLREVGLRDGLQLVRTILSPEQKLNWIRAEAAAGVAEIEVTSFVPPSVIPQFADAAEVLTGACAIPGLTASVLTPNLKGAERAFDHGARKVTFVLSASEAHNQANVRRTSEESLADFERIVAARDARGLQGATEICGIVATSFGCAIQGEVDEGRVIQIAERLAALGADEVSLADTVGYGDSGQVRRLFERVAPVVGDAALAAHFHDTRGLGVANLYAALEAGVRRFDASLGGLGGCPFAPGATGNVAFEDCAFLLHRLGFKVGVDFPALFETRARVVELLPDEAFSGRISKAGLPLGWT